MKPIIKRLRELESQASPAPWFKWNLSGTQDKGYFAVRAPHGSENRVVLWTNKELPEFENATLIAESRNALNAMLDVCDAAEKLVCPGEGYSYYRQRVELHNALKKLWSMADENDAG